ncbi:hypothetical protein VJ786_04020 [Sphingobacterium sp. PU5-4]|uniref:Uncharacterized protein n=1 Tax=Sphingobacterium tenebrionis TaxID=3111775 RepID=A0ABU8I3R4_9SPHI
MKDQEFDKIFKDNLRDFEVNPPENLWEKIESALDQEQPAKVKKMFPWKTWSIAATLLLALGFTFKLSQFKEEQVDPKKEYLAKIKEENESPKPDQMVAEKWGEPITKEAFESQEAKPNARTIALKEQSKKAVVIRAESRQQVQVPALQPIETTMELDGPNSLTREAEPLTAKSTAPQANLAVEPTEAILNKTEIVTTKPKQGLFVRLLNNVADNINIINKDVEFSEDEEGTIKINLSKLITKTK